jgi:hypothetical protein
MVVLDKIEIDARLAISLPTVGLQKKASLVTMDVGLDRRTPASGVSLTVITCAMPAFW